MSEGVVAAFRPDVRVRIAGPAFTLRHFVAEYGPSLTSDDGGDVPLSIRFVEARAPTHGIVFRGRYKTVAWTVDVSVEDQQRIDARIWVRGRPRSFVLSLVQGYFVEPLISLVSSERGYVLLPGSGVCLDDGVTLLLGRSGSGKSTLSAAALASGRRIVGDDQILLDRSGTAFSFPRRLRFYSDLGLTAPEAYARLPRAYRGALNARRVAVVATRGFVAPPIRVPAAAIGPDLPRDGQFVSRAVVIERTGEAEALKVTRQNVESIVALARVIIDEQRQHLSAAASAAWLSRLARTREREARLLSEALRGRTLARYEVPLSWGARRATHELGRRLGIAR